LGHRLTHSARIGDGLIECHRLARGAQGVERRFTQPIARRRHVPIDLGPIDCRQAPAAVAASPATASAMRIRLAQPQTFGEVRLSERDVTAAQPWTVARAVPPAPSLGGG